jgi:flagellar M-ring protein FliF
MGILENIQQVWEKVSLTQRVLLIAVVLTAGAGGTLIVQWARRPDMKLLCRGLSPEEIAQVVERIQAQDIHYDLRVNGTAVYVPGKDLYKLKMDVAREGIVSNSKSGYGIFDNEKIGISPFVQNVNLKRAQQDELAKSIQTIQGVVSARVHLSSSDTDNIFAGQDTESTASVIIKMRPGYNLTPDNVAAISNLVASAAGLKAENITITDAQGRLLSSKSNELFAGQAGTAQDYRERIEKYWKTKIETMLTTIIGNNRVSIEVGAVIDMKGSDTLTETPTVDTSQAITEETTTDTEPIVGDPNATPQEKTSKNTSATYAVGTTVKKEKILAGDIISLSVAGAVDLTSDDPNNPQPIWKIEDVNSIIKSVVNIKDPNAVTITIREAKFVRPSIPVFAEAEQDWTRYLTLAREASMGIMAFCALLVYMIFARARKKAGAAASQTSLAQLQAGAAGMLMEPSDDETQQVAVVRRQISSALKSNPDQVRELFASWMQES